jgi:hypothetical protein
LFKVLSKEDREQGLYIIVPFPLELLVAAMKVAHQFRRQIMPFSVILDNALLDHLFGKATFTTPTHIWVALSSVDPTIDGSAIVEPTTGGYARVETSPANWNAATAKVTTNAAAIDFSVTASPGYGDPIGWFALYDDATSTDAAHFLGYGEIPVPITIITNFTPRFEIGTLSITRT